MLVENVFNLDAIDVLAAADQHVLSPVDDIAETLFIQAGEIPRFYPSLNEGFRRFIGFVPVALHHLWAVAPDLANSIDAQSLPSWPHDFELTTRRRRSAALRAIFVLFREMAGDRR